MIVHLFTAAFFVSLCLVPALLCFVGNSLAAKIQEYHEGK